MELFIVLKLFTIVYACGSVIQALSFHLAMFKPRDHRYAKYMLDSFVMFCLSLGAWFAVNLIEATYLEMLARNAV
jgi:hypothetical protein